MAAAVIILFIALLLIGVPVGAAMGIPAFLYFIINGTSLSTIPYTFYTNLMSFSMWRTITTIVSPAENTAM